MSRTTLVLLLVLAVASGFGAGWIIRDSTQGSNVATIKPAKCRQYDILDPTSCIKR